MPTGSKPFLPNRSSFLTERIRLVFGSGTLLQGGFRSHVEAQPGALDQVVVLQIMRQLKK